MKTFTTTLAAAALAMAGIAHAEDADKPATRAAEGPVLMTDEQMDETVAGVGAASALLENHGTNRCLPVHPTGLKGVGRSNPVFIDAQPCA